MRLYRGLLRLYPASFRREYGDELVAVFAARRRQVEGPFAVGRLWLDTVFEVVANAALIHWDILRQDLRYTGRSLARMPGFAVTAVVVTALGVGANAAAFSVADYALVRPLPFAEPDRLVKLWQHPPGYTEMELSPANYRDWRAMSGSFDGMGAFTTFAANLVGTEEPERVEGTMASAEVFSVLGTAAALGRVFTEEETRPGAPRTVVLSHGFWRTRFAGDPGVIGRVIQLDGAPHQVVGVMPATFRFPNPSTRLWVPLTLTEASYEDRSDNYLEVVARLRPDVSIDRARADLAVVAGRLAELHPQANRETGATVTLLRDQFSSRTRLLLLALAGASLCILVIACANLGGLLLARGLARERELAVRTALGAGRERLVRQLATESLVLVAAGVVAGLAAAEVAMPVLARLVPPLLPMADDPAVNGRVLAFAIALAGLTCFLFAILPARHAGGGPGFEALRQGARAGDGRRERLRGALVALEIGASVVLLVTAGLLMRAIQRVNEVHPGFRTDGIVTLRTALPSPRYAVTAHRQRFYRKVLDDVRVLPGVSGAAYVSAVPLIWGGGIWPVIVRGEADIRSSANTASLRFVTPGYFRTMGITLHEGRDVAETDGQDDQPVAVVSASFAARYWPGRSPLGQTFRMAFAERQVVGVVDDIRLRGLERTSEPQVYLPAAQLADSSLTNYWAKDLVVAAASPTELLVSAIRRIVAAADPEQPVSDVRTMADVVGDQTASRVVQLRVLAALAGVALVLAAVGLHGLLSYMVAQRSREIGVRIALGARPVSVVTLVLRRGLFLALCGILPGTLVAWLAGQSLQAVLFGVPAADPLTFTVVIALCLAVTAAGCIVPAARAVRLEPLRVLRDG